MVRGRRLQAKLHSLYTINPPGPDHHVRVSIDCLNMYRRKSCSDECVSTWSGKILLNITTTPALIQSPYTSNSRFAFFFLKLLVSQCLNKYRCKYMRSNIEDSRSYDLTHAVGRPATDIDTEKFSQRHLPMVVHEVNMQRSDPAHSVWMPAARPNLSPGLDDNRDSIPLHT